MQILIGNLVLKSQLHAARLKEVPQEREATLHAAKDITELHPKLDTEFLKLTRKLDKIEQYLNNKTP